MVVMTPFDVHNVYFELLLCMSVQGDFRLAEGKAWMKSRRDGVCPP